ncbi:MAG: hypothetical protein V1725_05000 [archaeon]
MADTAVKPAHTLALPLSPFFSLAKKMTLAVMNERLYLPSATETDVILHLAGKQHYLMQSAWMPSLEQLVKMQHASIFTQAEQAWADAFLRKVKASACEDEDYDEDSDEQKHLRMITFAVTKVFPYFRNEDSQLDRMLGGKVNKKATPKIIDILQKPAWIIKEESRLNRQSLPDVARTSKSRLDCLLSTTSHVALADISQTYEPVSLLGEALHGRNIVIIDKTVHHLMKGVPSPTYIKEGRHRWSLVNAFPLEQVEPIYLAALERNMQRAGLEIAYTHCKEMEDLRQQIELQELATRKEYHDKGFGFVWKGDDLCIYLTVPAHVLKDPEQAQYYFFRESKAFLRITDDDPIEYDEDIVFYDRYAHPFVDETLCTGDYSHESRLNSLPVEGQIAGRLIDARNILLYGYTGHHSYAPENLRTFTRNKISHTEVKRRHLPVTNLHVMGKKYRGDEDDYY